MLPDSFYTYLASQLVGAARAGELFIAAGRGDDTWDRTPPALRRNVVQLQNEVARLPLTSLDYLDASEAISTTPMPVLRAATTFPAGSVVGTLRECGLLHEAGNGSTLLSYFFHPRIELQTSDALARSIRLDLRPGRSRVEEHITRYLGNTKSEEFHDLESETAGCQIGEIRVDRRHYFPSIDAALGLGYDYCARCFGRELSQR